MLRKILRKKLSEQQLSSIENLGETVGKRAKLDGVINKANEYLLKHRRVALPLIVLGTASMLVVGVLLDKARYDEEVFQVTEAPKSVSTDNPITEEYNKMVLEAIEISDSIQYLFERGNLSHEDSVYIASGMTYIENINQMKK